MASKEIVTGQKDLMVMKDPGNDEDLASLPDDSVSLFSSVSKASGRSCRSTQSAVFQRAVAKEAEMATKLS